MALSQKYQCAIIVLMLLLGVLLVVPLLSQGAGTVPLSVFMKNLVDSKSVAIVMDIRGLDADNARKVLQCGTNLAGSQLFVGKDLSNYACDDSGCLTAEQGSSKQTMLAYADLEDRIAGKTVFYVKGGSPDNPRFTATRSTIIVGSSFEGNCRITVQ